MFEIPLKPANANNKYLVHIPSVVMGMLITIIFTSLLSSSSAPCSAISAPTSPPASAAPGKPGAPSALPKKPTIKSCILTGDLTDTCMKDMNRALRVNKNAYAMKHDAWIKFLNNTNAIRDDKCHPTWNVIDEILLAFDWGCEYVMYIENSMLITDLEDNYHNRLEGKDFRVARFHAEAPVDMGIIIMHKSPQVFSLLFRNFECGQDHVNALEEIRVNKPEEWKKVVDVQQVDQLAGKRIQSLSASNKDPQKWRVRDFAVQFPRIKGCPKEAYDVFLRKFVQAAYLPPEDKNAKDDTSPPFANMLEVDLYDRIIKKSKRYLEFGTGATTSRVATLENIEFAVSVEAELARVRYLATTPSIRKAMETGKMDLYFVDVNGDPKVGNNPRDRSLMFNWPNYCDVIYRYPYFHFDTIFIDGRFRVYCALSIFNYISSDTVVVLHDYVGREHVYGPVTDFYEVLETVGSMYVLRKKVKVDLQKFEDALYWFSMDFG